MGSSTVLEHEKKKDAKSSVNAHRLRVSWTLWDKSFLLILQIIKEYELHCNFLLK